jgi:hypothetical protein
MTVGDCDPDRPAGPPVAGPGPASLHGSRSDRSAKPNLDSRRAVRACVTRSGATIPAPPATTVASGCNTAAGNPGLQWSATIRFSPSLENSGTVSASADRLRAGFAAGLTGRSWDRRMAAKRVYHGDQPFPLRAFGQIAFVQTFAELLVEPLGQHHDLVASPARAGQDSARLAPPAAAARKNSRLHLM